MASFLKIIATAGVAGITGTRGGFLRQLDRQFTRLEAEINRELRRDINEGRRLMRPILRRIYQQELRAAAPKRSGRLRRSIRVLVRNTGTDLIRARVRMAPHGWIMQNARWSEHYRWASRARLRTEVRVRAEAVEVLRRVTRRRR